MKYEMRGTIIELIDKNSGFILGDDDKRYFFSAVDFLEEFNVELKTEVLFKPKYYNSVNVYKATLISKA